MRIKYGGRWLLTLVFLLVIHSLVSAQKVGTGEYFYTLNTQHGLSDNNILQMMQLPDGKIVVKTQRGINLYDDSHFRFLPLNPKEAQEIRGYKGQSHLYVDGKNRLWVKDYQEVYAIDLHSFRLISHPLDSLASQSIEDVFVDSKHEVWVIMNHTSNPTANKTLVNLQSQLRLALNPVWGELQDMDVDDSHVYAFCAKGVVAAYSMDGKLAYVQHAYGKNDIEKYAATSLVVKNPGGQFYQIRTGGNHHSVFLHFDPNTRKYQSVYTCDYILHTLNMSSDRQALISSQHGYLMFDFKVSNLPQEVRELALPDGTSLVTGINTVYRDHDGGIWLGTYKDGLIYVSPLLGLFFTIDKPWWQGEWGIGLLIVILLYFVVALFIIFYRKKKKVQDTSLPEEVSSQIPMASPEEISSRNFFVSSEESLLSPEAESFPSDGFRNKLIALIEQHLSESDYGVEQLAKDLCMERTGLYKKLKTLTDESPVSLIRKVRLEKAAEMLKSSANDAMTVNEIAERTGFASPSYFTKCFKAKYGVKPSEYR